ncbi:alpha/beta fold hydrolase [Sphingobacterium hungaricum]|uniref:Alpha/beta hydrolase n=1 Tax=Sphingobacterium hungaricum TaxID=2082723 RepID=A0A928YS03_9SPHI|nr:alpha/beta hydrolase [Sphingobacterium hungaricum]MBE8713788.1 alpha/beta hydrolase [Sphingobacterium hungaricum]
MPILTNSKNNQVSINYVDYGKGQPVILIHGWPLSHKSWENQISAIVDAGYRCIAYDRRGFGGSSAPWDGYDYSSLASDLHELISHLGLDNVILVGFSMGGGEVVRYFTDYGSSKISKAALIASIIPLVKKKEDNPDGVPEEALDGIIESIKADRFAFLGNFHKGFYNFKSLSKDVSQEQLDFDFSVASHASPRATLEAAKAWMHTDFRVECKNVTVPTLIVHGKADQTVPIATSADQAAKLIPNNTYIIYDDAPHGLNVSHAEKLNADLLEFFRS